MTEKRSGGKRAGSGRKHYPPSKRMIARRVAVSLPPNYDAILDSFLKSKNKKYAEYLREKTMEDLMVYEKEKKQE